MATRKTTKKNAEEKPAEIIEVKKEMMKFIHIKNMKIY